MKFRVTMKSPDALSQALDDIPDNDDYEDAKELAEQYFQFQEYLTIEFDTGSKTATVVKK